MGVEAWKTTVQEGKKQGKGGRERAVGAWKDVGGAAALQPSLCWADGGRVPVSGRMFWPRAPGQLEARAGPLGRGRARARESVAQLKECVRRQPVVFR